MEEGIKAIWEALKSSFKMRLVCALTFLIAYFWIKNEVVAPKSQRNLYFWILIILLILGLLFLVSVIVDICYSIWDKRQEKNFQNKFEEDFDSLKGNDLKVVQNILESGKRSIVLGEDEPWTISLEDKGIIEKADATPEYSLFGANKKYEYKLTRRAVKAIIKRMNSNSDK